jgi:L-threonylcarbamoyladenylate synthase
MRKKSNASVPANNKIILVEAFENDIENSLKVLQNGELLLYPTDTIWGIGCDATNAKAVQKVYQLKGRAENKALIVLVADQRDLLKYVASLDLAVFDYLDSVAKPTTVIYEGAIGLAENLLGSDGTVAIRVCKDEFCKHLIKRFKKPIVSTSANISGDISPKNFTEITPAIKSGVNYIVNWKQHDLAPKEGSTIIKWEQGKVTVIRP